MPLSLSRRASADLDDIYNFGLQRWGREQADAYAAGFWRAVARILAHPRAVRLRDEATPPVRIVRYKAHLIVYREQDGAVLIIRVAHGRSDWVSGLG